MKQLKLTILLTVLISMMGVRAWAEHYGCIDGIHYCFNDDGTAVIYATNDTEVTGNVVIPSLAPYTYYYDDNHYTIITYRVTAID